MSASHTLIKHQCQNIGLMCNIVLKWLTENNTQNRLEGAYYPAPPLFSYCDANL